MRNFIFIDRDIAAPMLQLLHGDAQVVRWASADVDFVWCTTKLFAPALLRAISSEARRLRPGAFFAAVGQKLVAEAPHALAPAAAGDRDNLVLIDSLQYEFGWGQDHVFLYTVRAVLRSS